MLTLIVISAVAIFVAWWVLAFNSLVSARNATSQCWSNIEVELKRRVELVGNLIESVRSYSTYEVGTFEELVKKRQQQVSVESVPETIAIMNMLKTTASKLIGIAEGYPELKASENFLKLQRELAETENRIALRRDAYNETVKIYNQLKATFPTNLIASFHSFESKDFFDIPENEEQSIGVQM